MIATAKTPSASDPTMKSGVSLEFRNDFASRPARPSPYEPSFIVIAGPQSGGPVNLGRPDRRRVSRLEQFRKESLPGLRVIFRVSRIEVVQRCCRRARTRKRANHVSRSQIAAQRLL